LLLMKNHQHRASLRYQVHNSMVNDHYEGVC
jgi:hypothetical protein